MKCLIVDDETPAVYLMEDNIKKTPFLQLAGSCNNAYQAIEMIQKEKIDLVFLDIEMPGLNGTELIKTMAHQMPMVIFVTAYKQYALDGYELNVVDYLLKPVSYERFLTAVNKAAEFYRLKSPGNTASDPGYFFVHAAYSLVKIETGRILYIEAMGDYIKIILANAKEPVLSKATLTSLEEKLPSPAFLRIQKSFIINTAKIEAIRKNRVSVGGRLIPFSESRRDELFRIIAPGGSL